MRIPGTLFLVLALAIIAVCGSAFAEKTTPLDGPYSLGTPVTIGNLTVWPVYSKEKLDIGEFKTLQEAERAGVVVIREIGGGVGGQQRADQTRQLIGRQQVRGGGNAEVGRLVIINNGKLSILVCAGTVVVGGKQDRQIGKDFVIPAGKQVMVDSFCVEQGRWTATRGGKATDGRFRVAGYIAPEGVRKGGQYIGDQQEVWRNVAEVNGKRKTDKHGSSLAMASEKADKQSRERDARMAKTIQAYFEGSPAIGFAYAVNGVPVTVRTFAHRRVFQSQFGLFVPAMCMEAQLAADAKDKKPARTEDVVSFVAELQKAAETEAKTAGANINGVAKNKRGYRGTCYIIDGKKKVAVTKDWTRK